MGKITPPPSSGGGGGGLDESEVQALIDSSITSKAPLASPTFTGTPAAPTAAVGTNTTQVATTAHVQSSKLGVPSQFGMTGAWYPVIGGGVLSTLAVTAGRPYFTPMFIPRAMTLVQFGTWCQTGAASSAVHCAVYDDDDGGYPGTRLYDINGGAPWDSTANTTWRETTGLTVTLAAGAYWVGVLAVGGTPTIASNTSSGGYGIPVGGASIGSDPNAANVSGFQAGLYETTGSRTTLPSDVSSWTLANIAAVAIAYAST
jgi:hypothetical protein